MKPVEEAPQQQVAVLTKELAEVRAERDRLVRALADEEERFVRYRNQVAAQAEPPPGMEWPAFVVAAQAAEEEARVRARAAEREGLQLAAGRLDDPLGLSLVNGRDFHVDPIVVAR